MAERSRLKIHLSGPAKRDIAAILKWSWREFGEAAALRSEALLSQAMRDIAADPERPGSFSRPEIAVGARTCHLNSAGRMLAAIALNLPGILCSTANAAARLKSPAFFTTPRI